MIAELDDEFYVGVATGRVRDLVTRRLWTAPEWAEYQAAGHEQVRRVCLPGADQDDAITNSLADENVIDLPEPAPGNPFAGLPMPEIDLELAASVGYKIRKRRKAIQFMGLDGRSRGCQHLPGGVLAKEAGVSREWLSRLETGKVNPSPDSPELQRVFAALAEREAKYAAWLKKWDTGN